MLFYVYLIVSKNNNKPISYVGYSNNPIKRLLLHNTSGGAKFTKGKKWLLAYKKGYKSKSKALKEEYSLKKDRKRRNKIKNEFIYKNPHLFNKSTQL